MFLPRRAKCWAICFLGFQTLIGLVACSMLSLGCDGKRAGTGREKGLTESLEQAKDLEITDFELPSSSEN